MSSRISKIPPPSTVDELRAHPDPLIPAYRPSGLSFASVARQSRMTTYRALAKGQVPGAVRLSSRWFVSKAALLRLLDGDVQPAGEMRPDDVDAPPTADNGAIPGQVRAAR